MHHAWTRLFLTLFLSWLIWSLATPLVLGLGRRYPPIRLKPVTTWIIHLACCVLIGLISAAWEAALEKLLNPMLLPHGPGPFGLLWRDTFYDSGFQYVCLYAALVASGYILDSRQRLAQQQIETARLNEQFSAAQLNALRRQIEPHSLFNALNAIAGMVREQRNADAVTMIVRLSEFLRKVIEGSDRQKVSLGEEVEFLKNYLEIQKARFADRLQLSLDVPKELLPIQVPSLILQPIVENAVKHGIARQARGGWIRVTASRYNGHLTLRVYNDGPGLSAEWENSNSGIGISNVRGRLQTMYGDNFEFQLSTQAGGVEVLVSVPCEP
jgi:two-component system LytT family sensor kinase